MDQKHKQIVETFRKTAKENLLPALSTPLEAMDNFVEELEKLCLAFNVDVSEWEEDPKPLFAVLDFLRMMEEMGVLIEKGCKSLNPSDYSKVYTSYFRGLNQLLNQVPENETRIQSESRFSPAAADGKRMKVLVFFKRLAWKATQVPVIVGNVFRKPEQKVKPGFWKHNIPLRAVTEFHLQNKLALGTLPMLREWNRKIRVELYNLEEFSSSVDQSFILPGQLGLSGNDKESNPNIENLKIQNKAIPSGKIKKDKQAETLTDDKTIVLEGEVITTRNKFDLSKFRTVKEAIGKINRHFYRRFDATIDACVKEFEENLLKAGTLESSGLQYRRNMLDIQKLQLEKEYGRQSHAIQANHNVIWDTWIYNVELKTLDYFCQKEFFQLEHNFDNRINVKVNSKLKELEKYVDESAERISSHKGDQKGLKTLLLTEKRMAQKQLSQELVSQTVNLILGQDLPELIHRSEQSLGKRVERLSSFRRVLNPSLSDLSRNAIATEDLSTKQLINFEAYPKYSEASLKIKTAVFKNLSRIQNFIAEIDNTITFTLESALAALDEEEKKDMDPQDIAQKGLVRANLRVKDIYNELPLLLQEIENKLKRESLKFSQAVRQLLDLENLQLTKTEISASLAARRTKEVKEQFLNYFKNLIPIIFRWTRIKFGGLKKEYELFKIRLGLSDNPTLISTEIADYLEETKTSIEKLDFVYQRLFELQPATSETILLKRTEEIQAINKAHDHWEKGFFSPVVLIGERGSGITTQLLQFIRTLPSRTKIFHLEINEIIFDSEAFCKLFTDFFEQKKPFKNLDEIVEYLDNIEDKPIFVLEDIQHLFLKKVNGFEAIQMLFELMSKTNKNVFWLTSCTLYSWEYLHKTLNISDFFSYIIHMRELREADIKEVIMKRHRVSGYGVVFVPSDRIAKSGKFMRMSDSEKEDFLQKEFFTKLFNFSGSNISLAILHWLKSAEKVEGNNIYIELDELDSSFLNSLPDEKLFPINEVLLHNGLTEEQLALIRNIPIEKSRQVLLAMTDDGLLVKNGKLFEINLFLYRSLLKLLKSKNIIH